MDDASEISDDEEPRELKLRQKNRDLLERRGYKVSKFLGEGGGAEVFSATHYEQLCAVKVIVMSRTGDPLQPEILREMLILKEVSHPNVVRLFDIYRCKSGKRLLIFMELAQGDLDTYMKRKKCSIGEQRSAYYYCQFGEAMRYIHSIGIAHRDLKPEKSDAKCP